jgi:hypothetical protein
MQSQMNAEFRRIDRSAIAVTETRPQRLRRRRVRDQRTRGYHAGSGLLLRLLTWFVG